MTLRLEESRFLAAASLASTDDDIDLDCPLELVPVVVPTSTVLVIWWFCTLAVLVTFLEPLDTLAVTSLFVELPSLSIAAYAVPPLGPLTSANSLYELSAGTAPGAIKVYKIELVYSIFIVFLISFW